MGFLMGWFLSRLFEQEIAEKIPEFSPAAELLFQIQYFSLKLNLLVPFTNLVCQINDVDVLEHLHNYLHTFLLRCLECP